MPALRYTRGRARAHAGALAGILALVISTTPLGAQPAPAADPAAAPDAAPAAAPQASTVGDLSLRRSLAWVAIGTAAAFATTSAVLALAVESREQDIAFLIEFRAPVVDAPSRYDGEVRDRYEKLVDEAEALSTAAWITLGLTVAAAAAATNLFLLDDSGAGAGAPASARSHLAPTLLPGGMGATLDCAILGL